MTPKTTAQITRDNADALERIERKLDLVMLAAGLAIPDYGPAVREPRDFEEVTR